MIVITGGAGMIGSVIAWQLNQANRNDLIIVDRLHHENQWQNICHRKIANYLDKDELLPWLNRGHQIEAVIHMGAISATTERDFNRLAQDNLRYSQQLWQWCAENQVPFLYASSAATYGGGEFGYNDSETSLRPLNGYGYSKYLFDQWALRQVEIGALAPPLWVGFKFFNVYGPNEYHKERMASVALHTFNQFSQHGTMKLFKSDRPEIGDGQQLRDFVYVKDAAAVVTYFLDQKDKSGIYNVGSGEARSFADLSTSVMKSMGREPSITYIDMPTDLHGKYQYYTQADISKLRAAGYLHPFHSLEDGVDDYVQHYLMLPDPYC